MVESSPLAAPSSLTPRGADAAAAAASAGGDVTGPAAATAASRRRDKVGGGLSRAKAAHQKERLRILSTPQVRHHVMKDLTKVRAAAALFF